MVRKPEQPFLPIHWILLGFGIFCLVATIIMEIEKYVKAKPLIMRNEAEIKKYMYNWISRGGRVAIFSRDLSWVNEKPMKTLLLTKAKRSELCICVPEIIPLVNELQKAGAEICAYPQLGYIPSSRFTIINYDRADAAVAVGGKKDGKHLIREFAVGEHPFFSVANDLVNILKKVKKLSDSV
jgi:hypothetical protein